MLPVAEPVSEAEAVIEDGVERGAAAAVGIANLVRAGREAGVEPAAEVVGGYEPSAEDCEHRVVYRRFVTLPTTMSMSKNGEMREVTHLVSPSLKPQCQGDGRLSVRYGCCAFAQM